MKIQPNCVSQSLLLLVLDFFCDILAITTWASTTRARPHALSTCVAAARAQADSDNMHAHSTPISLVRQLSSLCSHLLGVPLEESTCCPKPPASALLPPWWLDPP